MSGTAASPARYVDPECARRRCVGTLGRLSWDVIAECLLWLDDSSLLLAGEVCRGVAGCVASARCWQRRFDLRCRGDEDWRAPPPECTPPCWKRLYHRYRRELERPSCVFHRSGVSRRFVWRIGALGKKLKPGDNGRARHYESQEVETYHTELLPRRATADVTTRWQLQLQRKTDDPRQVGVFLSQDQKTTMCYFSLGVLNHDYTPIKRYTAKKCFECQSKYGWFFSLEELEAAGMRGELIVEMDVTVFPKGVSCVSPFYKLLGRPEVDEQLKGVLVDWLAEYATHTAPNPNRAKKYLQQENPAPLVNAFESPATSYLLKGTIAGCLWNILDISPIYIASDMLDRIIRAACANLKRVLDDMQAPAATTALSFTFPEGPEDEHPCSKSIKMNVNSLCGLMWNIPVAPEHRALLIGCGDFLPGLERVLGLAAFRKSHFCCLHILCTLKFHGCLPAAGVASFDAYVQQYLAQVRDEERRGSRDLALGVSLSLRDVVEFFCPLLFGTDLTCIAFAQWAISVFYFGQVDTHSS